MVEKQSESPLDQGIAASAGWVGSTYEIQTPLRWGDLDALNHLNNTIYFRLMEECRFQLLLAAGITIPARQGPILAHASCDFLKAMTYPALARVRHTVTRLGRSSIEFELTIERSDEPQRLYARGRNVLVWFDYEAERSAPWPDDVLVRLRQQLTAAI
jgi:acyl-CoA thioester hydrolase